ncbi:hypothetical protein RHGRI_013358 [Rhododendron griersonianum]|uniref:Aquaporin PIP2-7-like n=1 Tax=Rhododendron griersonianum TaxID=479676 RepID=A0AAV6K5A4_9ERIC|nr:hypothetical protein RHGRI_013358 [Rhododendron griersonianum]
MLEEVNQEGQAHHHHHNGKEYVDPPQAPLIGMAELKLWSFYRALIVEFVATLLFLYITVATVIGHKKQTDPCDGVGLLGIAWAFGGHINPAVTFGLLLARKVSLIRAVAYMVAQCLGAISGVGLVKVFMKNNYNALGGGANSVAPGYDKGIALGAETIGTFVLVYTVFLATDPKRSARDSHVPWIFWVGPFVGALAAAAYHQYILRAAAFKALGSFLA